MGKVEKNSEKRRVLLVVRWPVGGIRTFLRYVYRHFDPDLWQFTLVLPEIDGLDALINDLAPLKIRYQFVKGIKTDETFGYGRFARAVWKELLKNRYSLVHSHGFTSAMCVAPFSLLFRTPHVLTAHETLNDGQFPGLLGRIKRFVVGFNLKMVNCLHSVSCDAEQNLLHFFPALAKHPERLFVIPNGIEIERFLTANSIGLRKKINVGENVFLIGFFGRFMSPKGFRHLVEAMEILAQQGQLHNKALVITYGRGGFFERDRREVERRGLTEFFRFMPFEPNIAGAIKEVDVVVMPSLWEACGLLAMETLVCGTPLIASNCIGLREVIKDTPAIQIPVRNAQAIADALKEIMEKPCKDSFTAFVAEAAKRFNVQKQVKGLEKLYNQLVAG